jgi:hypothetical protein
VYTCRTPKSKGLKAKKDEKGSVPKMANVKKLGSHQSIGLVDAVDRINTPYRKEDKEASRGSSRSANKSACSSSLRFEKFENRPLTEK